MEIKKLKRKNAVVHVFSWVAIGLVLLGFIGLIVCVLVAEFTEDAARSTACWFGALGSMGGVLLGLGGSLLLFRLGEKLRLKEADARELACSECTFFIGEKTMVTFEEKGLKIHAEEGAQGTFSPVLVPFTDVCFYTVSLRRSPRAKGERSVLLQVPARYTNKDAKKDEKPSLISMEYKQRLLDTIEKFGVKLARVENDSQMPAPHKLFEVKGENRKGKGNLISTVLGGLLLLAGVLIAVLGKEIATLGYVLGVLGVIALARGVMGLVRGGSAFIVYEDGVFWKEENKFESVYMRWTEVENFARMKHEKHYFVRFTCAYGAYYYPDANGLYDFLAERFPEKEGKK